MKILHLATSLKGGAGGAAYRTNESLIMNGIDSRIMSLTLDNERQRIGVVDYKRTPSNRFKSGVITKTQRMFIQKNDNLLTPISISQLDISNPIFEDVDIIHAHASYNFFNFSDLLKLQSNGKKIFVTLHDQRFFTGGCHYSYGCEMYEDSCKSCPQSTVVGKMLIKNHLESNLMMKYEISKFKFICPSNWLKKIAIQSSLLNESNVEVIANPVPRYFLERQNYEENSEYLKIGFCSADLNNPCKGLDLLREAIFLVLDSKPDIKIILNLFGSGEVVSFPQAVEVRVKNLKEDQEVAIELSKLDFLIVPSLADNSPSVISESLMSGTPVLGSSAGGIPEMIQNQDGAIFDSGNAKSLAANILKFNTDKNCNDISFRANRKFGYSEIAFAHLNYYNRH